MTRRVRFTPLLAAGCFVGAAAVAGAGEVPFEPRPPVALLGHPLEVITADLDHDGDSDLVATDDLGFAVAYLNAGDGSTWTTHTIGTVSAGAMVSAADIDGDGDVDLVTGGAATPSVFWFENTGGAGTVWTKHTVTTVLYSAGWVATGDIDRDGDQDILSSRASGNVLWFENSAGDGSAWVAHTVSTGGLLPAIAALADLDGDGDPDVVAASISTSVLWFENTAGNGSAWTLHTLAAPSFQPEVVPADLDRDGDLDLLTCTNGGLALWYENASGNATAWTMHTIGTFAAGLNSRRIAGLDVDGDGDVDLLVASPNDDRIAWFENVANASSWTPRTVATGIDGPRTAMAADVDGDGDTDVVSASFDSDTVVWYRNATLHGNACFAIRTVSAEVDGAQSAFPADVDRDGDLDVVTTAFLGDTVGWHENVGGAAQSFARHTISGAFDQAARVVAGDIDRDGDVDVAAVQGSFANGALTWFDNTAGNGTAWTPRTVSTAFGQAGALALADVNGDGDLDLMGSGYYTSGVRWFENAAGNGSAWTPGTVPALFGGQTAFVAADLDGDGDLDVSSTESFFGDGLGWTENTAGNGSAWTNHTISTILGATDSMAAADVDGDGDLDVVQPGTNSLVSNTAWYENVGGAGASWNPHFIPEGDGSVTAVGDLDRDGDVDVVTPGHGSGVAWHENVGGAGTTWTTRVIAGGTGLPGGLSVADLDRDGDLDVLSAVASTDTVSWYENRGGQAALAVVDQAPATANNGQLFSMLRLTATHLGRAGDGPLELASLGLLFEESPGDPLTSAEANAMIESLQVYRDANGSGAFEPATDVQVTSIGTLGLSAGVQVVPFTDGDPQVQVDQGTPRTYFVVVQLTLDASQQNPHQFRVTLLQNGASASVLEDRTYDIPLRLACPADVSSSIRQVVPVELTSFTVE